MVESFFSPELVLYCIVLLWYYGIIDMYMHMPEASINSFPGTKPYFPLFPLKKGSPVRVCKLPDCLTVSAIVRKFQVPCLFNS